MKQLNYCVHVHCPELFVTPVHVYMLVTEALLLRSDTVYFELMVLSSLDAVKGLLCGRRKTSSGLCSLAKLSLCSLVSFVLGFLVATWLKKFLDTKKW